MLNPSLPSVNNTDILFQFEKSAIFTKLPPGYCFKGVATLHEERQSKFIEETIQSCIMSQDNMEVIHISDDDEGDNDTTHAGSVDTSLGERTFGAVDTPKKYSKNDVDVFLKTFHAVTEMRESTLKQMEKLHKKMLQENAAHQLMVKEKYDIYACIRQEVNVELNDCSFCLEKIKTDEKEVTMINECRHVFHNACMGEWLKIGRTTCPLCRQQKITTTVWPADVIHMGVTFMKFVLK